MQAIAEKDQLLTTREAAEELRVSPQTLEVWRCAKRYQLAYVKIGRNVFYRQSAILAFIASRTIAA
jgi:DNA-binding transcriptional regulator YhcF (GntR family)